MSTSWPMSTDRGAASTPGKATGGRVVVASRLQLMAQAVVAALSGRGLSAESVPWDQARRRARRELGSGDVVVVLDDFAAVQDLEATCDLVSGTSARCVVLTRRPEGPTWGALLAAGAVAVLTPHGSLEDMDTLVSRVAGGEAVMDDVVCAGLVMAWERARAEDERLRARVAQLSPRETQILALLSRGSSVTAISDMLGVAETTVRSQVKSMRRKLGVDSQLGAVAVLHRVGLPARSRAAERAGTGAAPPPGR